MQIEKIVKWFDHLVVIPDGDDEGYKARDRAREVLESRIAVSSFATPKGSDPDELSDAEIQEIKTRFMS